MEKIHLFILDTQDDGHVFIPIFSTKYVGASTTYAKYMMMKK